MSNRWFLPMWAGVLCLATSYAVAQEAANQPREPLHLEVPFRAGDRLKIEVRQHRVQRGADMRAIDVTTVTPVEVEVLEADADGYVLEWLTGEPKVPGQKSDDLTRLLGGDRFELMIDRAGNYIGLRNWKAVSERAMRLVRDIDSRSPVPDDPAAIERMEEFFSDRAMVEQLMPRHAVLYFSPHGHRVVPGETVRQEVEVPNALGGPPLPATVTTTLTVPEDGSMRLISRQELDEPRSAAALGESMQDVAPEMEVPVDVIATMNFEEETEFLLATSDGYVQRVTHRRKVSLDEGERVDETTIELIAAQLVPR